MFGKKQFTAKDVEAWKTKRNVKKLLAAMHSEDSRICGLAADALVKIGDPATAVPILARMIDDNSICYGLRWDVQRIGTFSSPHETIPLYAKLLERSSVSRQAATVLDGMKMTAWAEMIDPLCEALRSSHVDARQWAAQLLAGLPVGPKIVAALTEALDDSDSNVRTTAGDWLGRTGNLPQ